MVQTARFEQTRVSYFSTTSWLGSTVGDIGWNSLSIRDDEVVHFDGTSKGKQEAEHASRISSGEAREARVELRIEYIPHVGQLSKLLPICVTVTRDGYTISCEELGLHASATSFDEVVEEFSEVFQEQSDFYLSVPDDKLSPRAATIRHNFQAVRPKQGK